MVAPDVATRIAADLMTQHLGAAPWRFGFDNAKRRAGACDYTRMRITLSRHLVAKAEQDEIRQVLLHEIAHALAGHRAAHGPKWKVVARRIGYTGSRLHAGDIANEQAPWIGACPAGHLHYRFRRPSRPLSCGRCARRFSGTALITWRRRSDAAPSADQPSGAAPSGAGQSTTLTSFQNAT